MNLASHRIRLLILAATLAVAAPRVFAQGFDTVRLTSAAPGADGGTVGAAVFVTDEYLGSDKRRTLVLPVVAYQWANGWFAGVTNGIGINLSATSDQQYGFRLTVDKGRRQDRVSSLRGMGDVNAAVEVGAFFNHALSQAFVLSSSLRYGSGDAHKGLVLDLGAGYSTEFSPRWYLSTGAGLTLANASYMQSFFGVTPAQSVASGYAVNPVGAGTRDLRANLALTYAINQKVSVTAAVSTSSLVGGARSSPLTQKRTSESGVIAVRYAY